MCDNLQSCGIRSTTVIMITTSKNVSILVNWVNLFLQMSTNFSNGSPPRHNYSSDHIRLPLGVACMKTEHGATVFSVFFITNSFLLLPSCILIFNLGVQRWRQQRATSPASAMKSPLDIFNNHYAIIELLLILSQLGCLCGIYANEVILQLSFSVLGFCWIGETSFQILICLERYLAVVYPLIFMRLRGETGRRIRSTILLGVWLLCAGTFPFVFKETVFAYVSMFYVLFSFIVEALCSLCVLRALVRSGPGELGQKREKVDKSKYMALNSILAILGSQSLKVFSFALWFGFNLSSVDPCYVVICEVWLTIPSHQVIPLLILQKAGKIKCCKHSSK